MLGHMGSHALGIAEEAQVPELVDLVGTDGLDAEVLLVPRQILGGATEEARHRHPAKVIFDVEASAKTRLGWPACAASPRMSIAGARFSVSGCTAYALSQKIRKSGAAVGIDTSSRATSSL